MIIKNDSPRFARLSFFWLLLACLFVTSCCAVALTGAGLGVNYTLTNVAYKTISAPVHEVERATFAALKNMQIEIFAHSKGLGTNKIEARTRELQILITLDEITAATTQIKVDAKKDVILKDKATAAEIINQVEKALRASLNHYPSNPWRPGFET